ncbi:MAG TPA: hypothetical protein VG122_21105 [Gemmata sp.]|jgi:hypothetical protein|nr:hypothetical protein [Gemmata sp.]
MSGWTPNQTPKRHIIQFAKFFLALGLLTGVVFVAGPSVGANQPPEKSPEIDDRSPLPPAGGMNQIDIAKLQIPNPDRAIFAGRKDTKGNLIPGTGIVDFEEIASEKKNSDEYMAWHEVVQYAKSLSTTDLEEFARRDLTRDDLIGLGPQPRVYRLSLIRFEGTIAKVRRLTATKSLQDAGTMEVYEAQLVPFDEPPTESVSVVFTELPEALAALAKKPMEQWMDVNADAVGAGYFFKAKQDPFQTDKVPVLIGKSVTMLKEPKELPSSANAANDENAKNRKNPIVLDKNLLVFKSIKDDARVTKGDENWQEAVAWNRVLLHARRFTPEELESNARTDIKFADLFDPVRRDYKLQLVRFEGRLLMVRKMEPSQKLRAAGLEAAYEGWLVPQDEPRGNPVCIVFTDLPEGIEFGRVNKWVSFAGYSFKLMRYESGERDKDDPSRNVTKRAPLLIGRAIISQRDPDAPSSVSWTAFVQVAVAVILGLLGTAIGLAWWFRRGDNRAKQEIIAHRSKNPFGE